MTSLLLPGVALDNVTIHSSYRQYLHKWLEEAVRDADDGVTAASICLQGALTELTLIGKLSYDWVGTMEELLQTAAGVPIAYSVGYSEKLNGFDNQAMQTTIAAIHARWWIERTAKGHDNIDNTKFAKLIDAKTDTKTGLIFDYDVSDTIIRHRMKTELTMSMALGLEILSAARPSDKDKYVDLATSLSSPKNCPPTCYMSTEYFRLTALRILGFECLFPANIELAIEKCATDLDVGYCDFPMTSKVDAYMGTAKRTARDTPIHSPLTAHHVLHLVDKVEDEKARQTISDRIARYRKHLENTPEDIPAFQMRDVAIPFGDGITPIEVICASHLIQQ